MKGYVITISLYENLNIEDMAHGVVRGVRTDMKTRFLLLLLLRISQRFLIYLRQIDRLSSKTEQKSSSRCSVWRNRWSTSRPR